MCIALARVFWMFDVWCCVQTTLQLLSWGEHWVCCSGLSVAGGAADLPVSILVESNGTNLDICLLNIIHYVRFLNFGLCIGHSLAY